MLATTVCTLYKRITVCIHKCMHKNKFHSPALNLIYWEKKEINATRKTTKTICVYECRGNEGKLCCMCMMFCARIMLYVQCTYNERRKEEKKNNERENTELGNAATAAAAASPVCDSNVNWDWAAFFLCIISFNVLSPLLPFYVSLCRSNHVKYHTIPFECIRAFVNVHTY